MQLSKWPAFTFSCPLSSRLRPSSHLCSPRRCHFLPPPTNSHASIRSAVAGQLRLQLSTSTASLQVFRQIANASRLSLTALLDRGFPCPCSALTGSFSPLRASIPRSVRVDYVYLAHHGYVCLTLHLAAPSLMTMLTATFASSSQEKQGPENGSLRFPHERWYVLSLVVSFTLWLEPTVSSSNLHSSFPSSWREANLFPFGWFHHGSEYSHQHKVVFKAASNSGLFSC